MNEDAEDDYYRSLHETRQDPDRDALNEIYDRMAESGEVETEQVKRYEPEDPPIFSDPLAAIVPILTRRSRTLDGAFLQLRHCAEMAFLPELTIEYDAEMRAIFRVDWYEAPEGRPTDQGPVYVGPPLFVHPVTGEMIEADG